MKTETGTRPEFRLMTLSHVVSFYHLQMPRWLFFDTAYKDMALESKVAYTFLLNRFQLSQRNGWVNERGEVYIIFTREELAREMRVGYKRAIACFRELADKRLIWEHRPGRGQPNRIYMAEVTLAPTPEDYDAAPFSSAPRPADSAYQDDCGETGEALDGVGSNDGLTCEPELLRPAETAHQEPQDLLERPLKNGYNGTSGAAKTAVPDLPKRRHSNTYGRNKDLSSTEEVDPSTDRTAAPALKAILEKSEVDTMFFPENAAALRSAVSWLYCCRELRVGNCVYPQERVRERLKLLTSDALDLALDRVADNTGAELRNPDAYIGKAIFSAIAETGNERRLLPDRCAGGRSA